MTTLLFDTSAVIALVERGHADAASIVRRSGDRPYVSFATIAEIHVGVSMAPTPVDATRRRRTMRRALTFRQLPLDHAILDHYALVRAMRIRGNDAWIVASAVQVGATLVTEDVTMAERAAGLLDVVVLQ